MPQTQLSISPQQLATLLQSRDQRAFAMLYDCYAEALSGVIYNMVMNRAVSEDLLQDVFVKVWRYIESYDAGKGTLFTWMINITRRTCIDYIRSKHNRLSVKIIAEIKDHTTLLPSVLYPNYNLVNIGLRRMTQKLDLKNRQVIEMVYFRGRTNEEVSKILNIPIGTVKTRSRAALKQLRYLYV